MLPTTGKQMGTPSASNKLSNTSTAFDSNAVLIQGGGNLQVDAGGDVKGGVYFVDRGSARLEADGSVTGGKQYRSGPLFAMGDTDFKVQSRGDIAVGTVFNPSLVQPSYSSDKKALFTTYGNESAIALTSVGGNVVFNNDIGAVRSNYQKWTRSGATVTKSDIMSTDWEGVLTLYPGTLNAQALSGDIDLIRSFTLFPTPEGDLQLLAGGSVTTGQAGNKVEVNLSDADAAQLPRIGLPQTTMNAVMLKLQIDGAAKNTHATQPVHLDDSTPVRVVAKTGDISSRDSKNQLVFGLAKRAEFTAGRDIFNIGLKVQNVRPGDVTLMQAGRDIKYSESINVLTGEGGTGQPLEVSGPGYFQMVAGRNIDLGASIGVNTIGDTFNAALADEGASFSAWAGQVEKPDYEAFFRHYFVEEGRYDFHIGNLSREDSLALLNRLPEAYRRLIAQKVLFSELRVAGSAHLGAPLTNALASIAEGKGAVSIDHEALKKLGADVADPVGRVTLPANGRARAEAVKSSGYQLGYQAIDLLFPGTQWKGDVSLFKSKMHTVDGGDIALVVPGGRVNAGLAGEVDKKPDELGIIVQRTGAMDVFTKHDFLVNRARVMTLGGGDLTAWSSFGDIDAGKGARGALAAPPPTISFDADGNPVVEFPPVVSGSGIRTVASGDDDAGDVFLAAPNGVIDAGEAGIAGQNVFVAAASLLNAGNIEVGGASFGTPTAAAPPVVVPGADGAAASATKSAGASDEGLSAKSAESADAGQKAGSLNMLSVDLVGFGDCSVGEVREGKAGCGG